MEPSSSKYLPIANFDINFHIYMAEVKVVNCRKNTKHMKTLASLQVQGEFVVHQMRLHQTTDLLNARDDDVLSFIN